MDIVTLVQSVGINLKPLGNNMYRGFCPFHNDKNTPNLTIYSETNSFYCFSCHAGGTMIGFMMRFYNLSYQQALEKLYGKEHIKYILNKEKEHLDYKDIFHTLISKEIYKAWKTNPNTFIIMKEIDDYLKNNEIYTFHEMDNLFLKYRQLLNNY